MTRGGLRVVGEGPEAPPPDAGPPVYPLPAGLGLGQFAHIDWSPGKWLGGEMQARSRTDPAGVCAWLALMAHAFATQTPGGTLPVEDWRLADLAVGGDLARWGAVRATALTGWSVVQVLDTDGGAQLRLAHPDVTAEAVRLAGAAAAFERRKADNDLHQARSRIRGQLRRIGAGQALFAHERIEAIRAFIERHRDGRLTRAAVEDAIEATRAGLPGLSETVRPDSR